MPSHYPGTAREKRALDAFIKLVRASETVNARLNAALAKHSLTAGQLGVLEALLHLGTLGQTELGEKLLRSKANMTTVLDNLEREGLVKRTRDEADRRVIRVSLTRAGKGRIESAFPAHADRLARLFDALSPEEQDELGRLCKKLGLGARDADP
jgi:MarR family 2-MHQ and catechol resistance regulon transcriptional repressor